MKWFVLLATMAVMLAVSSRGSMLGFFVAVICYLSCRLGKPDSPASAARSRHIALGILLVVAAGLVLSVFNVPWLTQGLEAMLKLNDPYRGISHGRLRPDRALGSRPRLVGGTTFAGRWIQGARASDAYGRRPTTPTWAAGRYRRVGIRRLPVDLRLCGCRLRSATPRPDAPSRRCLGGGAISFTASSSRAP